MYKFIMIALMSLCLFITTAFVPTTQATTTTTVASVQADIWIGSENLSGYGRLVFIFATTGNRVTMVDAKSITEGTSVRNGNSLVLTFPNSSVYTGVVNGNTFSGTATNGNGQAWNFSVSYYQ